MEAILLKNGIKCIYKLRRPDMSEQEKFCLLYTSKTAQVEIRIQKRKTPPEVRPAKKNREAVPPTAQFQAAVCQATPFQAAVRQATQFQAAVPQAILFPTVIS